MAKLAFNCRLSPAQFFSWHRLWLREKNQSRDFRRPLHRCFNKQPRPRHPLWRRTSRDRCCADRSEIARSGSCKTIWLLGSRTRTPLGPFPILGGVTKMAAKRSGRLTQTAMRSKSLRLVGQITFQNAPNDVRQRRVKGQRHHWSCHDANAFVQSCADKLLAASNPPMVTVVQTSTDLSAWRPHAHTRLYCPAAGTADIISIATNVRILQALVMSVLLYATKIRPC